MSQRAKVAVLDCKGCGRTGVGALAELRRFGWRTFGEHACPACQGLSGVVAATTDHMKAASAS